MARTPCSGMVEHMGEFDSLRGKPFCEVNIPSLHPKQAFQNCANVAHIRRKPTSKAAPLL